MTIVQYLCKLVPFKGNHLTLNKNTLLFRKMSKSAFVKYSFVFFLSLNCYRSHSQDSSFIFKSFYGLEIGSLNTRFTASSLEPGYKVSSVSALPVGLRLTLIGYRFNKHLLAFITYMRPVDWVKYNSINGDNKSHTVWLNYGTFSLSGNLPLTKKMSLNSELGFVVFTRKGFEIQDVPVVKDAGYTTTVLSLGLGYHFNHKWSLLAKSSFIPSNQKEKQPATFFTSLGFKYDLRPLSKERTEEFKKGELYFPKYILQIGYSSSLAGYSANNLVKKYHIFWGGNVEVESGSSARFLHKILNTKKVFSLYLGGDISSWKSNIKHEKFYTISAFPVLNFTAFRTNHTNIYLFYSVAGPSYISKEDLDSLDTGDKFTFRDSMGAGIISGRKQKLNVELSIGHYSNGNFYPDNPGIKIPLSLNLGYVF